MFFLEGFWPQWFCRTVYSMLLKESGLSQDNIGMLSFDGTMSADLPKIENIKIRQRYFTAHVDNLELKLFSQDSFMYVTFLHARATTLRGKKKSRACVCIEESTRGANGSDYSPKME